MKKKYFVLLILLLMMGGWLAYYLISPLFIVVELDEELLAPGGKNGAAAEEGNGPKAVQEVSVVHEMLFQEGEHEVKGKLLVIEQDGKTILRFEDFETINGPNLHVWLAKDLEGENHIDLGPLKATKGNFNYELAEGVNLQEYRYVLIWCVPFRVLFSFVELLF